MVGNVGIVENVGNAAIGALAGGWSGWLRPLLGSTVGPETRWLAVVAGVALLLLGRRLFWLTLGLMGFLSVHRLSLEVLHLKPPELRLLLAVVAGVFGALLAIFVQRVAVAVGGFLFGAGLAASLLGLQLAHGLPVRPDPLSLVLVVVAGVVAALVALRLFGLALIILSSLVGAGLLVDAARLVATPRLVVFILLAGAGMAIQAGWAGRSRARA